MVRALPDWMVAIAASDQPPSRVRGRPWGGLGSVHVVLKMKSMRAIETGPPPPLSGRVLVSQRQCVS